MSTRAATEAHDDGATGQRADAITHTPLDEDLTFFSPTSFVINGISVASPSGRTQEATVAVEGLYEKLADSRTGSSLVRPTFDVPLEQAEAFQALIHQADARLIPPLALPLPTGPTSFTSVREIITSIRMILRSEVHLTEEATSLLAFWALSTWFSDALQVAPCLILCGDPRAGDAILRRLRSVCRNPFLLADADHNTLLKLNWKIPHTLLLRSPHLSKRMASLLDASTSRGYAVLGKDNQCIDLFGPKALLMGASPNPNPVPHASLSVVLEVGTKVASLVPNRQFDETVQRLQNQLLAFRLAHLPTVFRSTFDVPELCAEGHDIASALGACLIGDRGLEQELIALLAPSATQQLADRADTLEAYCVEAVLTMGHQGKDQVLVKEIAEQVNRMLQDRGGSVKLNPEKVGHCLKRLGLTTRRLSQAGNGLELDRVTLQRVHRLGATYLGTSSCSQEGHPSCEFGMTIQ